MKARSVLIKKQMGNSLFMAFFTTISAMFCFIINVYAQNDIVEMHKMGAKLQDKHNFPYGINKVSNNKSTVLIDSRNNLALDNAKGDSNKGFNKMAIIENRPEDKLHPEYGKMKLVNSPNSEELMAMRTQNSRTFKNPDGSFTTQTSSFPVHYVEDNIFKSIDKKIQRIDDAKSVEFAYFNKDNIFKTYYPKSLKHGVLNDFGNDRRILDFINPKLYYLDETNTPHEIFKIGDDAIIQAQGNEINYQKSFGNSIDVMFIADFGRRKQEFIIKDNDFFDEIPESVKKLVFEEQVMLPQGYKAVLIDDAIVIYDDNNIEFAFYESPFIYDYSSEFEKDSAIKKTESAAKKIDSIDNKTAYYEISQNNNVLTIKTIVSMRWMRDSKRVFPLVIDPTLTASAAYNTTFYYSDNYASPSYKTATSAGAAAGSVITNVNLSINSANHYYYSGFWIPYTGHCGDYHTWELASTSGSSYYNTCGGDFMDWNGENPNQTWTLTLKSFDGDEYACNFGFTVTVTYATLPAPTSTCSATFYDNGGAGGNYTNNQSYAVTYQSADGRNIKAAFTSFNVHASDYLKIYDGEDFTANVIGEYTGANSPGTIVSSGTSLTFLFYSNASNVAAGWAANISCSPNNTYYSYQNGNWENATTWTTDPSGTLSVSPAVPGAGDKAVILNGRTVTATASGKTVDIVEIQDGAILNLQATTGHTFGVVTGQGRLRTSASTLPAGSMTYFTSASGGTVEYYGAASFTFDRNTFNNLILNLSNDASIATVGNNFTINGDLTIKSGNFRLGNSTSAITVSAWNDVLLEADGKVSVHTQGAHNFDLYGDLTVNSGASFKLHNLANPSYATAITNGKADLRCLNDIADQLITADGALEPYWLIVDKGSDQTYMVDVQASGNYFKLFGHTFEQINNNITITNGTLKLGANIIIPQIAHNDGSDGLFWLPENAHLWIDGANVTTTDYPTYGRGDGFYIYGKITISSGSLNDNSEIGMILRETGVIQIDNGTLSTSVIRPSVNTGTHRGTYIQNGGIVNVKRDIETARANSFNMYASLSLPYPDNVFQMSGGVLNILNSTISGDVGAEFSLLLSANPENITISGGEINITVPANRNAKILSKSALYNLNISSTSNTYAALLDDYVAPAWPTIPAAAIQPLLILNDFSISNPARFDASNQNVTIGGNFSIETGATYIPGTNATVFNGSAGQIFTNAGTITSGLYTIQLSNSSILSISNDLTVRNQFLTGETTVFRDMGNTVSIGGNITHSGIHESQALGCLALNGAGAQIISGDGTFDNLSLNKASGTTTASSNIMVNGDLRLANTAAVFNLATYRLTLAAGSKIYDDMTGTTYNNFSATRMIQTAGNMSDGGVKMDINSTGDYLYPIGVSGKLTKANITFNAAPTQWGSINICPVNNYHPLRTSDDALSYYWRVSSDNLSGITSGMLEQRFYYDDSDINGTEADYVPGVYNPVSWTYTTTDKVTGLTNEILFDAITNPDGDFTAGETSAFGVVEAYYSWSNGQWTTPATWSTSETVYTPPATAPTATSAVVIQSGHTITISSNNQTAGYLIIEENATLDLATTTGHNFGALDNGQITGKGLMRISSAANPAQFPSGDFGEFLGEDGGTVEYYYTSTNFRLPASGPYTYYNLIINASGRILQPDYDFMVYNNFTKTGTNDFRLNAASTNTIDIRGNLIISQGNFQFYNNAVQTIKVSGNLEISGTLSVANQNGASNIFEVYGDIINNGTMDLYVSATRNANLYFLGIEEQTFSGIGTTDFYKVIVDKGSSQDYLVNVTANNFTIYTGIAQTLAINNGTIKFNGPTSTVSGNFDFDIPETACLEIAGGAITVGGGNNVADIILAGKVVVSGGTLNVGPGTNFNNDIEIAGAGVPSIEVSGGTLNVNGQIRRSNTSVAGALRYTQSGGAVNIYGRNRQATRALFEVLNNGSEFNISGGSINLINGGGTTFGDLYLDADSYLAEGGTIVIGSGATATTSFNLYLGNPIWSLTIDGTTNAKTAYLKSFPANIYGDLQISTAAVASVFNVGNLDVNIGGDFINYSTSSINPYVLLPGQITTFIGKKATQALTNNGALLRFRNLLINHSSDVGVVTFSGTQQIVVYEDLKIEKGILEINNQAITLLGNIYNNKTYRSLLNGYITFGNNTVDQNIYGTDGATFGSFRTTANRKVNAYINMNVVGAYIVLANNSNLNMGDKNIKFSYNTSFSAFNGTNYIITNGALSDGGVSRTWSGTGSFTFPIGVAGKYTPATINVTNTGGAAGTITVKPVNSYHPSVQTGFGNDELQYYWNVVSENFGASPTVNHVYTYLDADVQGTETDYVGGRFYNYQWVPDNGIAGAVNTTNNTISLTAVNYIDGEYTAGDDLNFVSKPTLYSRVVSGNWEDVNSWSTSPTGAPIASAAPDGNPVVIQTGHTITTTANGAYAYSVDIENNAVLAVGTTREHNLGHVSGSGTLKISATASGSFIFPGGYYDVFMNTAGSTVEYNGTGTLPSSITTYQNVVYSGAASVKNIPSIDFTVLGNLEIREGYLDNSSYDGDITVVGNWTSLTSSGFIPGRGMVTFTGLTSQINSVGGEHFYDLKINKTLGTLTLASPVAVSHYLYLTEGIIYTDAVNILTLSWTSDNAAVGASSLSFVDGPLKKNISSGAAFYFPVGDDARFANTRVFTTSTSGYWTVQYFNDPPSNASNLAVPLQMVSTNEYWTITGPGSSTAKVQLRWDTESDIIPATASGRQKLRVAQYLSGNWTSVGDIVNDGGINSGTVQTDDAVSTNLSQLFTLGLEETATAHITGTTAEMCDDGTSLPVTIEFTGDGPFDLIYTINGANNDTILNIGSSSYEILFQYSDLYDIAGVGAYLIELLKVNDGSDNEGVILSGDATLTLLATPAPIITGDDKVIASTSESYSVQLVAGETYSWTASMGVINGSSTSRTVTIDWGAATGNGWVEVTVINSATLCSRTERLDVEIRDWPVISGEFSVCANGLYQYSTPLYLGHTYSWTVNDGGVIVGSNTNNTVNVLWGTEAAGSITVVQNDGSGDDSDTRLVTINSNDNTWDGSEDTDWENIENWTCNCLPNDNLDAIIPAGVVNMPTIDAYTTTLQNLTLATNATLNMNNGAAITVSNQLDLNGLLTTDATSYIQLGTDAAHLGTLVYSGGRIIGEFRRWVSGSGTDIDFPLGTSTHNRWVRMRYTTAPTAGIINSNYVTTGLESIFTTGDLYGNMPFSDDTIWIDNISQRGLWMINPNAVNGVSGGTYDIKFYTHGIAEILDPDGLRMIKRSATSGDWVIPGAHGGVEVIDEASFSYWVSRTGVATFSYYALAGKISDNPLPITLTNFSGKWIDGNVTLNWTTQSETNNDYFIVERSNNMHDFYEIARVKGKGNSHVTSNYTLVDDNITEAGYYYKLKQVDFDGATTDLPAVYVKVPVLNDNMLRVYPQPAKEVLYVEIKLPYKSSLQMEIRNAMGAKVLNEKYELEAGSQVISLDTKEFVPGYYVLIISDGINTYRKQLILGI